MIIDFFISFDRPRHSIKLLVFSRNIVCFPLLIYLNTWFLSKNRNSYFLYELNLVESNINICGKFIWFIDGKIKLNGYIKYISIQSLIRSIASVSIFRRLFILNRIDLISKDLLCWYWYYLKMIFGEKNVQISVYYVV